MFNPFPNAPGVTDLGEGRKLLESWTHGHCFEMLEPDGKISMTIIANSTPRPKPKPVPDNAFQVRCATNGYEIVDKDGDLAATTTSLEMARHICKLLITYVNIKKRQQERTESTATA